MFGSNLQKSFFQKKKRFQAKGYSYKADFVFILGMHRSGTSCLAGSLERCGLFLGDVVRQSSQHNDNAKGSHELKAAMRIHDEILADNNGSWYQPPTHISVNRRRKKALMEIIAHLAETVPCGIKDPRLVLLLDIWTELVDSYAMIGTFRHPTAVVRSLVKRNQLSENDAYNLWLRYNTNLVQWHKQYHFPLIEFDLSQIEKYQRSVTSCVKALGLQPNLSLLDEFITPNLDHNCATGDIIPEQCRKIYTYLTCNSYQIVSPVS